MVGAPSPTEPGLFYQWGDIVGHTIADGYDFSTANYEAKGLNLISSDLDDAHDAARAYYGPEAKMPSVSQLEELQGNCSFSNQGNGVLLITSNINGHSIKLRGNGFVTNFEHSLFDIIRAWSKTIRDEDTAYSIHGERFPAGIFYNDRYLGYNVLAVHS